MANPQDDNVVATGLADIADLRRRLQCLSAQRLDVDKRAKSIAKDFSGQKADLNAEIKTVVDQLENLEKSL